MTTCFISIFYSINQLAKISRWQNLFKLLNLFLRVEPAVHTYELVYSLYVVGAKDDWALYGVLRIRVKL